jgi:Lamin Tail Domain
MRRNCFVLLVVILVCSAASVAAYFLARPIMDSISAQLAQRTATPTLTGSGTPGLTTNIGKPKPIADYFKGCPPSGDGGDPVLNTLKNRIDEGQWQTTTISALLTLTWPKSIEQRPRSRWSSTDEEAIAQHEGTPIQVEGYLVSAKKQGPESCNCHSVEDVDFHIWITDDPNKDRTQSVVIEVTPRVTFVHPNWTLARLSTIAKNHEKVRISGWLMVDPEHPDQIGKTRGTVWEIHPVMQIETQILGSWTPLDNGTTGIISAPATSQEAPTIVPVDTATVPPVGNENVQDNTTVQITKIFFNGTQGSTEPDEYVEITNTGPQPVNITDWELQDTTGDREYKWESYVMQPGQSIRVYTNEIHAESGGFSFAASRAIWGNSGDIAELYDADKQLISRYAYGNKR